MKNKQKTILISIAMALALLVAILCCVFIPTPKPSKIYKNSLDSIVELKASTENVGESFGTAEFIDNDGTLITNAHVVTYTRMGIIF